MPHLLEASVGGALETHLHSPDISGAVFRLVPLCCLLLWSREVQAGLPCRLR
jgi:hypothetical protein